MASASATTLAGLIPTAASRAPASDAILDLTTSMSWADAALETGRLGAALTAAGIGPGDRVGVHYRKSAESFLAMHAVVQRGAIAVPLDPKASGDYLSSVAKQTDCRALLTHQLCAPSALAVGQSVASVATIIGLDDAEAGPSTAIEATLMADGEVAAMDPIDPVIVNADDPAYIITTSGSTGRPKGICHTHRSAMAYVRFKLAAYDFGAADRISDIAPNHFDISTLALWVTPAIGASNIVVREQYQMLPASLSQLMADTKMTVFYGVPYLLTQLMTRGSLLERDLEQLRWVLFGGEVMSASVLAELMESIPGATFSNVYGPAEVNACAIHHLDKPPGPEEDIPIGGPVSDTEIRLTVLNNSELGLGLGLWIWPRSGPSRRKRRDLGQSANDDGRLLGRARTRSTIDSSRRRWALVSNGRSWLATQGWCPGLCWTHRPSSQGTRPSSRTRSDRVGYRGAARDRGRRGHRRSGRRRQRRHHRRSRGATTRLLRTAGAHRGVGPCQPAAAGVCLSIDLVPGTLNANDG